MKTLTSTACKLALIAIPAICTFQYPLHADELSELYLNSSNNNSGSAIGPNILFILDTSASMTDHPGFIFDPETFWDAPYDPDTVYDGPCDPDKVYRKSVDSDEHLDTDGNLLVQVVDEDTGRKYPYAVDSNGDFDGPAFQRCRDSDGDEVDYYFPKVALHCQKAREAFHDPERGWYQDKIIVKRLEDYVKYSWYSPSTDHRDHEGDLRECSDDYGYHGHNTNDTYTHRYPAYYNGYEYVDSATHSRAFHPDDYGNGTELIIADGNFLNWFFAAQSRFAVLKAAFREAMESTPASAYAGIMRFDIKLSHEGSSDGGMMIKEFVKVGDGTNRQDLVDTVFGIPEGIRGGTPLGETLLEALLVFSGRGVLFGDGAHIAYDTDGDYLVDEFLDQDSVPASRNPDDFDKYQSPIQWECQKSAVMYMSDGVPDGDKNTWQHFNDLPNHENYVPEDSSGDPVDCDGDDWSSDWQDNNVSCLPNVAEYMANEDMSSLTGAQTVTTSTVGFGADLDADAQRFLQHVAEKGGGTFTQATSFEELRDAFEVVIRDAVAENASLASPAVTVNAFNRLAHEDKLIFTMFDPLLDTVSWPGNVKKYKLRKVDGEFRIVDSTGTPALATNSSTIVHDALSFWTNPSDQEILDNGGADGNQTRLGGAAGELSTDYMWTPRKIYSWLDTSTSDLTDWENRFASTNGRITNEMVGLDPASSEFTNLIRYMRGWDVKDEDGDDDVWESRKHIGAAPHGVPAIVTYGDDEATSVQVIFAPTNDGMLHAIDAETGAELWAFVPEEAMGHFADIYEMPSDPYIGYGLDAPIVTYTEGTAATDRKWMFFGMRRGGKAIYALDVTDKDSPKVLWRKRPDLDDDFSALAQTWSDPTVARLKLGATDSDGTPVLVFGGGYDASTQDSAAADTGYVDDTAGNALFIVEAETGDRLWWASNSGADWNHADMESSIAAPVAVKDKNEDGFADLVYAADLGGRIWRFDIDNESNSASSLSVTGGKIASLGAGATNADNRKFFARPDVVLVAKDGFMHWAINLGSGDRERPKSNRTDTDSGYTGTTNYLFSVRDEAVFDARTDYSDVVTIDDLYDATDNAIQSSDSQTAEDALSDLGNADGWKVELENNGEKALAEAKTYDFRVFFTTFDPTPLDTGACNSDPGRARLYSLDLVHAGAVIDIDSDGLDADDRIKELPHGTIPPAVTFMFVQDEYGNVEATNLIGRADERADLGNSGTFRKTFWNIEREDEREQ